MPFKEVLSKGHMKYMRVLKPVKDIFDKSEHTGKSIWKVDCILPYFSIDNAHLMYNAHPKLFRHSFRCIDNAHDVFFDR